WAPTMTAVRLSLKSAPAYVAPGSAESRTHTPCPRGLLAFLISGNRGKGLCTHHHTLCRIPPAIVSVWRGPCGAGTLARGLALHSVGILRLCCSCFTPVSCPNSPKSKPLPAALPCILSVF